MTKEKNVILTARDIVVEFDVRDKVLTAIRGVSLELVEGEVLALVGESGSGKSVLTKTFTGMLEENGRIAQGSIDYRGQDLTALSSHKDWEQIRGAKIATIFQDPMTSLDPIKTIGSQITEVIVKHQGKTAKEAKELAIDYMNKVGIPDADRRFNEYPFQYSGGMRQRIVIAIALACRPDVLICDEPTTALDVTIQAQIIDLLKSLQNEYHFTTIFITHDLGVVASIADKVAVMYAGEIVEYGTVEEVFYDPRHPYTWSLLSSLPQLADDKGDLYSIPGTPPSLYTDLKGDAFALRSDYAMQIDFEQKAPQFSVSETHWAKTWLLHLVEIKDLEISFGEGSKKFVAVKNANFFINKGETFSLVGESGSGKTTIGRAIIGLNDTSNGDIIFDGQKINGKKSREQAAELIRRIQMIFQDPAASLNERATVDYIISEGLYNHRLFKDEEERKEKVQNIIREVGLLAEHLTRYPHEFSGGQRQRIGIARALVMQPDFVIADEPISALDVSVRAQVLNLLKKFQKELGLTYLFIAHDLSVVRFISDRIAVIYKGVIVEVAETEELFNNPIHPYTQALLSAVPIPDPILERKKVLKVYDPSQHDYETDKPSMVEIRPGHYVWANQAELARYQKGLN